jgi:DNA-binding PadR family transcriptional regulator
MTNPTRLTEVEGCALGVVWQRGPCTAYEVRMEFAISSTPRWSASAGSIYPALKRLLARKLVEAAAEDWGPRSRTRFAITRRGLAALHRWVGPPFAAGVVGPAFDPLRTRSCFLGAMARPARARFVDHARRATRTALGALRAEARRPFAPGDFEAMSVSGSILELEARLSWLDQLRRTLGGHAPIATPVATRRTAGATARPRGPSPSSAPPRARRAAPSQRRRA